MKPQISIVSTIYKSAGTIARFVDECLMVLQSMNCASFELVIVNDGSPDESRDILLNLRQSHPEITLIELSRNFGHHYALSAGLDYCMGDLIFLIDSDLQVGPQILPHFHRELTDSDFDVVYGYQEQRNGSWFEAASGQMFWRLFNFISETRVPPNVVTERLMSRKYVDALKQLSERNLFLGGMMYWIGFKQKGIPITKAARTGKSSYNLARKIDLFVNAITSFTPGPLKVIFHAGLVITALSVVLAASVVIRKLASPESTLVGWTSLLAVVLLGLGFITCCLGIIGIYLSKIFIQVQQRPKYLISAIYQGLSGENSMRAPQ